MSGHQNDARLREAALVLHGLHWRDRFWLLRQLLPRWRHALRRLLRELRQLGIDASLGRQDALPHPLALPGLDAELVLAVDAARPDRISRLMDGQSPALQAQLLVLHAWQWREAVWTSLSPFSKRHLCEQLALARAVRTGAANALLQAVAQALPGAEDAA